jgi:hypothetical protein
MEAGFASMTERVDGLENSLGEMIGEVGARVDQVDAEMKAFREEVGQRFDRLEP